MKIAYEDQIAAAEVAIRATGERLTAPRTAVLACLLATGRAASHLDVADNLAANHPVDRVTVYRVLEWLVKTGIAHRIAGDDRVWRFMISPGQGGAKPAPQRLHSHHAHFTCATCGQTFCLDEVSPDIKVQVPAGFLASEIELMVRGRCADCV
jgi:Fur family ferric uptake transcriptional regulator